MPALPARRSFFRSSSALLAATLGAPLLGRSASTPRLPALAFMHPDCLGHLAGERHPEHPGRLEAVRAVLTAAPLAPRLGIAVPKPARPEDLLLCHTRRYIELVEREIAAGARVLSTGDTQLSAGSWKAALAAAGSVTSAVDAVLTGRTRTAFCAVRPPGHHASPARGMGFCLFNNIALGARHAQRRHGVGRVLIADWDVHHGNGTQDIFWSDGSVLFFDTHQNDWYPGTGAASERGEGRGEGLIINRPFAAGAGREEILGAFRDTLLPAAERFRPELVMISAGFDSRRDDPLGRLRLDDRDYAELTDLMLGIADRYAGGRLVSVLEGGYSGEGLASAVGAHVGRLLAAG